MKLHGSMKCNNRGNLEIGGLDTRDLVAQFGTPLIVFDEILIRNNCREYYRAFTGKYKGAQVLYASKAFCAPSLCKIIEQEGLGIDIVSGGELYTALQSGFPTEKIYFHGNNKSAAELKMALENQVGCFVVDSSYELYMLNKFASEKKVRPKILLRISPGIEANTHKYVQTGQVDSKFGFTLPNGQALKIIQNLTDYPHLEFKGIHCHIGSQVFDVDFYLKAADLMLGFMVEVKEKTGLICEELNLGGGFGIYYANSDQPIPVQSYAEAILKAVIEFSEKKDYPLPKVIVEPGRSITGNAGTTLYTIGSIKNIPGIRKYVAVDGGMSDNLRPSLYQAKYEAIVANKMTLNKEDLVSVAGKCCESGDILIWDTMLQKAEPGDILAVSSTGAYSYAMSNNYNSLPRPAVVLVKDGKVDLIIKRESYEQVLQNHIIPARLSNEA